MAEREEVALDDGSDDEKENENYDELETVRVKFNVEKCEGRSLYEYLPKFLNSLTQAELEERPMSIKEFQKYINRTHLEQTMQIGLRRMGLKEDRLFTVDDFQFGFPLGKGAFGTVYLARLKKTHFICALKMLHKSKVNEYSMAEQVKVETESGYKLHHPLILTMYDVFHDDKRFYFVLEYAPNGQLYRFLQKLGRFSDRLAATYIYQVCHALAYCHSKGVIHRDLKPENILLDCCGNLKLADFGWSAKIRAQELNSTACGTLDYLAPEIVSHNKYQYNIDNWCVGVLTYELLCGRAPFEGSDEETKKKISTVDYKCPKDYVTTHAEHFINNLLQKDPNMRMSLTACIEHKWLRLNAYKYLFGPYKCPVYITME
ncbi:unnamed protein product [Didymodactylos carnosus]|uniref:Aurora kinase n=2 Tax=Didymodactylos carnosus TaxID=1234261 RepID=A0A815WD91_9BILA|nr:unnamed protein product [Didymodactylos carnosus]CAF4402885.1 unnamed protein product [Didymodactylos carnosus]